MTAFHRPPRVREIVQPAEIELPAAPVAPRDLHRTPLARLLFMTLLPALLPPVAFGLATWALGQSSTVIITSMALSGGLGLAVVITVLMSRRDEDIRVRAEKDEYAANLARHRARMQAIDSRCAELVARETRILGREFPGQPALDEAARSASSRLWERRPGDNDFLEVRLGTGARRSCIVFKCPGGQDVDPLADGVESAHAKIAPGPVTVGLAPGTTKGVFGAPAQVDALIRSVAHQVALQHSPSEVRLAVFSRDEALCDWAKWLPHCRLASQRETVPLVGRTGVEASTALRAIAQEVTARGVSGDSDAAYVVLADGRSWDSLPGRLKRWLGDEHAAVCLVVAEERFEDLPSNCDEVFDLSSNPARILRKTEPGTPPTFVPDPFDDSPTLQSALAIADLADGAEGLRTPVPRSTRLADVLGPHSSPEAIAAEWERSRTAFKLAAPIGMGPNDQVFELDLRKDGPHGLLAGTTGSGKSELLQSLVASFSVRIPPDLLNFVLIDYKGGSTFSEVAGLPQVVGVVSDLDERIARRALESLRAEMKRREHLLASVTPAAANIIEYQAVRRGVPLANLVIIIDEFHRLVTEQPDFIEEMVRIAQQGRSLGVHLLLSTQKPSGVVTDQIRANTNLRIALRVTDDADSRDVLDSEEAAAIPRDVPGRFYMRVGTDPLRVCQAGRISGMAPRHEDGAEGVSGRPFLEVVRTRVVRRPGIAARLLPRADDADPDDDDDIELVDERTRLVEAVQAAAKLARLPRSEAPWREPLANALRLEDIEAPTDALAATQAVVGVLDEPELQRQRPFLVDLADGHVCIAGSANSGKSTSLLTVAEAFATKFDRSQLHIYGVDFAGGDLTALKGLPHCGGVAAQHEWPRVRWVVQALKDTVAERLAATSGETPPHILVLVDNFTSFWNALQDSESGQELADDVTRVMDVGRAVGVTFAITLERPDALRTNLFAMMATRLALPMADAEGYAALGLSKATQKAEPIQGRAIVAGRTPHETQLGFPARVLGLEPWPVGDSAPGPLKIAPLPVSVPYQDALAAAGEAPRDALIVGLRQGTHPLFAVPAGQHLALLGPRRTGRSNALAVVLQELRRTGHQRVFVANPRRSAALREAASRWGGSASYAERAEEMQALFDSLAEETERAFARYSTGEEPSDRWAVVIDDADVLDITGRGSDALEKLVLRGADVAATIYLAADTQALRASYPSGVIRALLNQRTGILFAPNTTEDFDLLGARGRPAPMGPGRGWWCEGGGKTAVQVGLG